MPQMPLDLDAIEARYRRVWRDTKHGRRLSLTTRLVAAQEGAGDVPALVARVRALEAALAEIAALAEATAQALDLLRGDERHLAYWPVLARLRDLRRLAEGVMRSDADPAPEGGA